MTEDQKDFMRRLVAVVSDLVVNGGVVSQETKDNADLLRIDVEWIFND